MNNDQYAKKLINQQEFHDGISLDDKLGTPNSLQYLRGFDWRKKATELTQARQAVRIDSGNLDGLIINIVQAATGERFALTDNGSVWLIKATNAVRKIGTISETGAFGMLYREDLDTLYIAGLSALHTFSPVKSASTRALLVNAVAQNYSTNTTGSKPSIRTGGTKVTALGSALDEGQRLTVTSDIEPLRKLRLNVSAIGTGSWTVVMHDPLNRQMGTKTIANGSMATGEVDFDFGADIEMLVRPNARQYHFHIYSSDGTGSIISGETNGFETADFKLIAQRFVANRNHIHWMEHFLQYIAIGHGRYIALWEPLTEAPDNTEYKRHMITAPDGFEACGGAKTDEFLIGAFEKRSTNAGRISQEGLLVFWDGLSGDGINGSYNFYIELKEGAPQALYTVDNIPHIIVGGTLYVYLGGKQLTRVRDLPNIDNDFTGVKDDTDLYPYMMASHRKMIHIAHPSTSSNTNLEFGIYSFGRLAPEFNPSFGLSYVLSHGSLNTGATVLKIGTVASFGDEMYVSWQQGTKYGLDLIDSNSPVAASFKARLRKFDARNIHKKKGAHRVLITTAPVPEGTSVYPTYTVDDDAEVVSDTPMAEGDTQAVLVIDGNEFKQIDVGLEGTSESDVTKPLRVRGIGLEWDPKTDEDLTDGQQ